MDLPRIISVDDHVVEPPELWIDRLPASLRELAPRVERVRGNVASAWGEPPKGAAADWTDCWIYEGVRFPLIRGNCQVGYPDDPPLKSVTFEEIHPAAYEQSARLDAMDQNDTDVCMTFPTFPRFCGQRFLEAEDKDLALACLRVYNDWMIDEWCAGDAFGRIIPITLVPLWDIDLAIAEVRRCAEAGSHSITFCERPPALGLPSLYTDYWDGLWAACQETETVVNVHIGSSSQVPTTSPDAPYELRGAILWDNAQHALADWLVSGVPHRFPRLKLALSEGMVGWMPFVLQSLDHEWHKNDLYGEWKDRLPEPPSSYVGGRIYGCMIDDQIGLRNRDVIGMGQIMFEVDFPHADTTFPESRATAQKAVAQAGLSDHEAWQLLRGNAIECYGLNRWGVTS